MRFSLDAEPWELQDKGTDFLESLQKALAPHAPDLADALEKALPAPEPKLKYKALRAIHERTQKLYERQLSRMLDDVNKVISKARVDKLKKGDPTMAPFAQDEAKYEKVKALVMERGGYGPEDFEEGGPLYGQSTNQLLEMLKAAPLQKAGPFIGPRGGKWADAAHTIPWKAETPEGQVDRNEVNNTLVPDTDPYGDEGYTHFYHATRTPIQKIREGTFGTFMFFEANAKSDHAGPYHYKVLVKDDDIVEASSLFYRDDADKLDSFVEKIMDKHDVDRDTAVGMIDGTLNVWEKWPDEDAEDLTELSFATQKYGGIAARILGFRGASLEDEHGTVYLIDMEGHGNDLQLIDAPAHKKAG